MRSRVGDNDVHPCRARLFKEELAIVVTAAELAKRANTSEKGMRILCDFMTIQGFLTKQDGAYGLFIAGESDPVFTIQLHQGDDLGFEEDCRFRRLGRAADR